jgi:hypothetical protein
MRGTGAENQEVRQQDIKEAGKKTTQQGKKSEE